MRYRGLLLAAAAALAVLPAITPAASEPASAGFALKGNAPAAAKVAYYGYPGYYGYGYYGYGPYYGGPLDVPGDVLAGTAGVAGDILGAPYAGPYPRAGIVACARHFRSFNPATGTYTTYSGEQVLCPYLGG